MHLLGGGGEIRAVATAIAAPVAAVVVMGGCS